MPFYSYVDVEEGVIRSFGEGSQFQLENQQNRYPNVYIPFNNDEVITRSVDVVFGEDGSDQSAVTLHVDSDKLRNKLIATMWAIGSGEPDDKIVAMQFILICDTDAEAIKALEPFFS